jgi:hypothetical protein
MFNTEPWIIIRTVIQPTRVICQRFTISLEGTRKQRLAVRALANPASRCKKISLQLSSPDISQVKCF